MRIICFLTGAIFISSLIWALIDIWDVVMASTGIDAIGYISALYFFILAFLPMGLLMLYIGIKGEV